MWIAMAFIIVGGALQACAYSVSHIMIARYITGIGTGIETSTVPMYQVSAARICLLGPQSKCTESGRMSESQYDQS